MVKIIEETKKNFTPYKIMVETQEEHDFLRGLLNAGETCEKEDCISYQISVNKEFFKAVDSQE